MKRSLIFGFTILISLCSWTGYIYAYPGSWPNKPITVYVGWSAGGSSDVTTRALTLEMEKVLGQKILVVNVTGALGSIAATQVANAKPDGYLWFGGGAVHGVWPIVGYSNVSWTNFYAFLNVVFPTTIFVLKNAPWKSVEDLIADIKTNPKGRFKYGHPGAGSNGKIFAGLVLDAAGIAEKVTSIPYKGGREAGRYLLSGETDFASVTMGDLTDWVVADRVRPLVNFSSEEVVFRGITFPSILDVYPELEPYLVINPYFGVYIHRDTPEEIIIRIAEAFAYAIKQDGFEKIAIDERAGILIPKMGLASDQQMSKIESARGWALYNLGIAPNDPAKFGVPPLNDWSWPPHERAVQLSPWPQKVESIYEQIR